MDSRPLVYEGSNLLQQQDPDDRSAHRQISPYLRLFKQYPKGENQGNDSSHLGECSYGSRSGYSEDLSRNHLKRNA